MDRCNIDRRLLTPNIVISGIIVSIPNLSFSRLFYFIFPILSFTPTQSNNIYHILYYKMFEIHSHQPFNQCFFFFGCLYNTFTTQSIWSFSIINTFISVLMFLSILLVFFIIISIFCVFNFCNRIILISMWRIISFRLWSICSCRIILV